LTLNGIPKEFFIPPATEVIFVADFFASDITGGAELTSEALINKCPKSFFKLHSQSLTSQMATKNKDKIWVLLNWKGADIQAIFTLFKNQSKVYFVEYDYKYCQFRSSHLHKLQTGKDCDCHLTQYGDLIAAFYQASKHVFFMSQKQKEQYDLLFPNIKLNATVLSSVWEEKDFHTFKDIRANRIANDKWAILKGGSWIKNQQATEAYAKDNGLEYDLIGGLPYEQFLVELGKYKGLLFHPAGFDTCPRLVIEAKLMGLELNLNDNVQHKDEDWFNKSIPEIEEYLIDGPNRFWRILAENK
jgi:hypothetical protein